MGVWSSLFVLLVSLKLPEVKYLEYDKFLLRTRAIYDLLDPDVVIAMEIVVVTVLLTCSLMVVVVYLYFVRKIRKGYPLQNSTQNKSMILSPLKNNIEDIGKLEISISDLFLEEGQGSTGTEDPCLHSAATDKPTLVNKMSIQVLRCVNITATFTKFDGHSTSTVSKKYNLCNKQKIKIYKRHKSVRLPFRYKIKVYTISKRKFVHKVPPPVFRIQKLSDVLLEGNCVEISALHVSVYRFGEENVSPFREEVRSTNTKAMLETPLPEYSEEEIPMCLPTCRCRRKL